MRGAGQGKKWLLQTLIQAARRGTIAPGLRKSCDLEDTDGGIEPDGQDVAGLDRVARRLLPHAVDADMAGFDQRRGAGAGLHDPRMPQPFVEALAIQAFFGLYL